MAFDLVAAFVRPGEPFYTANVSPGEVALDAAPQQITLRFSPGVEIDPTSLAGISVVRSGRGGDAFEPSISSQFADSNVTIGSITVNDAPNQNEVVIRFAETLPDDTYRINVGAGLKTVPAPGATTGDSVNATSFNVRLNLGAYVVSVVPQPVIRAKTIEFKARPSDGDLLTVSVRGKQMVLEFDNNDAVAAAGNIRVGIANTGNLSADLASLAAAVETAILSGAAGAPATVFGTPSELAGAVRSGAALTLSGVSFTPVVSATRGGAALAASVITIGDGALSQLRNTVVVHFNSNDPLWRASAETVANYRLIEVDPASGDDVGLPLLPLEVAYDSGAANAVLTFATALANGKLFRLEVGNLGSVDGAAIVHAESGAETNSSYGSAVSLGQLASAGASVSGNIRRRDTVPTPAGSLQFPTQPGSIDEVGHRDIPVDGGAEQHGIAEAGAFDAVSIPLRPYNFQSAYGFDPQGNPLFNAITETQKQRAREIFDLYSQYTGVRFIETADQGITVVTGDMRAISPNISTAPAGLAGAGKVIMDSTENWGVSEYGGYWFQVAMHEIGHALNLEHSYDIPSIMGNGLSGEDVFPGDYDLIHMEMLYPNTGSDIDIYSFTLDTAGHVTAETVVARPEAAVTSYLDTVLTLYREVTVNGATTREMIARNDDYYGRDSFIGLDLAAADGDENPYTYYVAVTSTGNTAFNPAVENSGYGGRTQGAYELRLGFEAVALPAETIIDASGASLDGDRDGVAGGMFKFWFNTASEAATVYVDKAAPAAGAAGTLANPYTEIDVAIAAVNAANALAAGSKKLIRIVGNDGNAASLTDDKPYLIGRAQGQSGTVLQDGATFNVPRGVTAIIDEGAVLKLRGAVIDVGSASTQSSESRAGAALQVLGTPERSVRLTSYHDDQWGGNSDGVGPAVSGGQWGGIVLRQDSDAASNRSFVNTVAHADIRYGGGQVLVNSQLSTFTPIQLETTRPTIAFNRITQSAGAAISADPNSFDDSNGRIGPELRGNVLTGNSINGLFVRISTSAGGAISKLTVPARFKSTDIVYVIAENLVIDGGAGGYLRSVVDTARATGRLTIDPGVVVKLAGTRIELERGGSRLYAEGLPGSQVIFTSLADNRFGAGGTFDTNGNQPNTPRAGDWGGIVLNAGAGASIDNAYIGFGGGSSAIEGSVASFNVVETHQGELRLANSRVENNAGGFSATDGKRTGRGTNAAATIFVRGAQPVIVGNDFRDNLGVLVSVNANALNDRLLGDTGRSTGELGRVPGYDDNFGPLVRDNVISYTIDASAGRPAGGAISGMEVRAEEITVEGIWDDTDIVHVLRGEIIVNNFHTATGLQLLSRADASLVVKLLGANAGLTAAGFGLQIDDRIGGTVQILGQPGYPVVMTSLYDDTAYASLDPVGIPVRDTGHDGSATASAPGNWRGMRFLQMSNDRNVAVVREVELSYSGGNAALEINGDVDSAQRLGVLGPNFATNNSQGFANSWESAQEKGGDDVRRLGFEVSGTIAFDDPTDADVYAFQGYAGSEVWIDIDKTSPSLDAMVELLDANGIVLARSADSLRDASLSASVLRREEPVVDRGPLTRDAWRGEGTYSTNPRDPGMRVTLPGVTGDLTRYFIRVRSQPKQDTANLANFAGASDLERYEASLVSPGFDQPGNAAQGATSGSYQLRVRLRQQDEKPGSTVRYADIRYPVVGIDVSGLPRNSLLVGENGENATDANEARGSAQQLGNLLATDRNTISVAGAIASATDVDWYSFTLSYTDIQSIGGVNGGGKTWATMFDIDYADGFRGDLTLSVFDASGTLIYVGRDSNIEDDQPGADQGNDFDDLSRGSLGKLDPFIGSVQMPTGASGSGFTYYVAISSNERLPTVMNATFQSDAANPLIRLEPVNSVRRIVEDHIGSVGYLSPDPTDPERVNRISPTGDRLIAINDGGDALPALAAQIVPFTLADVVLYVTTSTGLYTVDPMHGVIAFPSDPTDPRNGGYRNEIANSFTGVGDIDMRTDGRLFQVAGVSGDAANVALLRELDVGTGAVLSEQGDGVPTPPVVPNGQAPNPADIWQMNSSTVDAVAIKRTGVGQYVNEVYYSLRGTPNVPDPENPPGVNRGNGSYLYRANTAGNAAGPVTSGFSVRGRIIDADNLLEDTTGMQFQSEGGELYGVSRNGFFYKINQSNGNATRLIDFRPSLGVGVGFEGLATAPVNLRGGPNSDSGWYAGKFFAITTQGKLVCIDPAANPGSNVQVEEGVLLGNVFDNNGDGTAEATISNVMVGGAKGLAFSPLDINLWHPTTYRGEDAGHGVNAAPDKTRSSASGGISMYFGLEEYSPTPPYDINGFSGQYGAGASWQQDLTSNSAIGTNYNLPGGARGKLETGSFNLAGYTYADKPTLYFNYFLDTTDSATVSISVDGGAWEPLAGINAQSVPSASARISSEPKDQQQQNLYATSNWRQARIDLGEYAGVAGANNIRLQFAFEAGMTNNLDEGFFIDDIIIGFAERGEMVTGATAGQSDFFTIGTPTTDPFAQQILTGPYQLEIRRGTEYAQTLDRGKADATIDQTFDTNERMVRSNENGLYLGDSNHVREQGQFIIENNIISDAYQYGIRVDAADRTAGTNAPTPGVVRNLPTLNGDRLVPGAVISNNVILGSGTAGIRFSGQTNAATVPNAAVPFGRIFNNTIYGGETPVGLGVDVTDNAGPTLLNNIFAGLVTGVNVADAGSRAQSFVGYSAYYNTTQSVNGVSETNSISLVANPFVNVAGRNFYLAAGSLAIDSSLDALQDRDAYRVVKDAVGIPPSPILAPDYDLYGQLRLDDPGVAGGAPGIGLNVFKDRGAVERADFTQPVASLVVPNASESVIALQEAAARGQSRFVLQLADAGAGIDDSTVSSAAFTVRYRPLVSSAAWSNEAALVAGSDYVFTYLENTKTVVFEAPAVFNYGQYLIVVNNAVVRDRAGNPLLNNDVAGSGTTAFEIGLSDVPSAPTGFGVSLSENPDTGALSVTLSWAAAAANGSPVIDYEVAEANGTAPANAPVTVAGGTSYTFAGLTENSTYSFTVRARNVLGTGPASEAITFIALPLPRFRLKIDSGRAGEAPTLSDNTTNDPTFEIYQGLAPTDQWQYTFDGGTTWRDGDGSRKFDLPQDGTYAPGAIGVRRIVGGMSAGARFSTVAFTLDRVVAAPTVALASDTGSSSSDGITKDGRAAVGLLEAGTLWEYSTDAGANWTVGAGGELVLPEGVYATNAVRVRQADLAGNQSLVGSLASAVTVDQTAPAAVAWAITDSGNPTDFVTNNSLVTLSGVEAGARWQYRNTVSTLGQYVDGQGSSFNLPLGASSGAVRQIDMAGNIGQETRYPPTGDVILDTTVATPVLTLRADTGISSTDRITKDGTILVAGLEAGGVWEFRTSSTAAWSTLATTSFLLPDGIYAGGQVQVRQTDLAGNVSIVGVLVVGVEVDSRVNEPSAVLAEDTGRSAADRITRNGRVNVLIEAGATWRYSRNAGGAWTSGVGTFFVLPAGTYAADAVVVEQTDKAGNSAYTALAAITVDVAVAKPTLTLQEDTGSPTDGITANGRINVTDLETGATWEFSTNSGTTWTAGSTTNGVAFFTLSEGAYSANAIRVRQTDTAGNIAPAAYAKAVTVDASTPTVVSVSSAAADGVYGFSRTTSVPIRVTFNKPVLVSGAPVLQLNTSPARTAVYTGGSGTNTLTFTYTIQAGDSSADLGYAATDSLTGGTIVNGAGTAANRVLPAPGSRLSLNGSKAIVIQTVITASASVGTTALSTSSGSPTAVTSAVRLVTLTFNTDVTGVTLANLRFLKNGSPVAWGATTLTRVNARTYRIALPTALTTGAGDYRLELGGASSPIASGIRTMTAAAAFYWRQS